MAIRSLGHLCFPFRFDKLRISLMGFQSRPDSYTIERRNMGFNGWLCLISGIWTEMCGDTLEELSGGLVRVKGIKGA